MISRISGILREIKESKESTVVVEVGGLCYDVSVSKWTLEKLKSQDALEKPAHFFTLYFIEGNLAVGTLTPRLIGFLEEAERDFIGIFTTVKGLGIRKALKAMIHPFYDIATAIETGNTEFLKGLPEIGPRTANRIVAEVKGKMAPFTQTSPDDEAPPSASLEKELPFKIEALEILLQLGYKKNEAERIISQTLAQNPKIKEADELIQAVYQQNK